MASSNRLDTSITLTVGADGTVTSLPFGPTRYGDSWRVTLMSMQTSGNTFNTAKFFIYRGSPSPINQVDYTQKVDGDTSNTDFSLQAGEYLTCVMTGATPGAIVTLHVTGELNVVR